MPSTTMMMSIGILVISFILGILFYLLITNEDKERKKKHAENILSLLINFILYIWIGKVVIHMNLFVQDPLAVLAYPSDSRAFYIASVLIMVNIYYLTTKKGLDARHLFNTFVPVFIATSFIFEFTQLVIYKHDNLLPILFLWMLLLIGYVFVYGKWANTLVNVIFATASLIILFILTLLKDTVTFFGYMISPFYFISLLILVFIIIVYSNRRKVS
ncbi:hypothetical protein [Pseudogracilibacillus sp. SO30301A]|uniref:hypothetical protein n=1 Tax=Pseudogracilibacillus sp. SO30301A TaxID=3098291 RepID=UPI00300E5744